ncbi:MAG: right-handed parallel beta-helix repeat-containing protein [Phycisphaerales bacterium]|nr:right-handed parallel beta-helix repeat-containing protein [Phycisphaerales bacterium]
MGIQFAPRFFICLVTTSLSLGVAARSQELQPATPAGFAPFPVSAADYSMFARPGAHALENVELGTGQATLDLQSFDVIAPESMLVAVTIDSEQMLNRPEVAMFRGEVRGESDSRVFLSVSPYGVYGFISRGADEFIVSSGPPAAGQPTLIYNLRSPAAAAIQFNPFTCASDLLPVIHEATETGGVAGVIPCRNIDLAIETDQEYLGLFGGNTAAANAYMATLIGAVSEVYRRDANLSFLIVYSRLWTTTDPWDQGNTYDQLFQYRDYWNANMTGVNRDLVHFLSGRALGGGIAWVGATCELEYDYALSANLNAYFPYPIQNNHSQNWDLMVVAHELGHNVGAPHTHNMTPPVDCCGGAYGSSGCNDTQDCTAAEQDIGTIMSYCHICPGGMTNVRMEFHARTVNEEILPYLDTRDGPCGIGPRAATITDQPNNVLTMAGASVSFTVAASHAWPMSYQWRRNGLIVTNGGAISGATTATLTINPVDASHVGSYDVRITTSCGSAATSAAATLSICTGTRLYVNDDAAGGGDGSSWTLAYRKLRDAIDYLNTPCGAQVTEIWVGAGTYRPDETNANPNGNGDRTATFQMRSGVAIIGGFRGLPGDEGAINNTTRPLDGVTGRPTLESILSGDLNGNDGGEPPNYANYGDNCFHVVTGDGTNSTAILDGFTVRNGYAEGSQPFPDNHAGGMLIQSGSPTVRNCDFRYHRSLSGGAMLIIGSIASTHPAIDNCLFLDNNAGNNGGAINVSHAAPTITNTEFRSNSAQTLGGGAISIAGTSSVTVRNCSFAANVAVAAGGGAVHSDGGAPLFARCTFDSNSAAEEGGAIRTTGSGSPLIVDSKFVGNTTGFLGGAISVQIASTPVLSNCTLWANHAGYNGGGIFVDLSSSVLVANSIAWGNTDSGSPAGNVQIFNYSGAAAATVSHSNVQDGWAYAGSNNINADPLFVDGDGADNTLGTLDDNLRLLSGSPCIDAGRNSDVPPDAADLDGDGNTTEPTPLDLDGNPRFLDATCTANTGVAGNGYTQIVDMGAYEYVESDCDNDGIGDPCDSIDHIEITAQPQSQTVAECDSVIFDIDVTGAGPITYQWRLNGVDIPGANQAALLIDPVLLGDAGNYDVVMAGVCGDAASNVATLTVSGPLRGDANCDCRVDNFDIDPFVTALTNPALYASLYPDCPPSHTDVNGDGAVNNFDIDPFVLLLTGG